PGFVELIIARGVLPPFGALAAKPPSRRHHPTASSQAPFVPLGGDAPPDRLPSVGVSPLPGLLWPLRSGAVARGVSRTGLLQPFCRVQSGRAWSAVRRREHLSWDPYRDELHGKHHFSGLS